MTDTSAYSIIWGRIVVHIVVLIGLLAVIQYISNSISISTGLSIHQSNFLYVPFIAILSYLIYKKSIDKKIKKPSIACFNSSIIILIFSLIFVILESRAGEYGDSTFIDVELEKVSPSNSDLVVGNAVVDFMEYREAQCGLICEAATILGLRQPYFLADAPVTEELWRVGGTSDGRKYHQSDGLRPIIIEYEQGTLYLFRNGDFYLWRRIQNGAFQTSINIDLDNFNLLENSRKPTIRYNIEFVAEEFEELGADFFSGRFTFYEHICDEHGDFRPAANLSNPIVLAVTCQTGIQAYFSGSSQIVSGTRFDDNIAVSEGNIVIVPDAGNDRIVLAAGPNVVTISRTSYLQGAHKLIERFDPSGGDILDLRHVIEPAVFEPYNTDAIRNHVRLNQTPDGIEVWVDPDGPSREFVQKHVATLAGLTLTEPYDLLSNGSMAFFD